MQNLGRHAFCTITNLQSWVSLHQDRSIYAILNVGDTINHVNENSERKITITHEPSNSDPSHSGIRGYSYEDEMIGDLIAEKVVSTHPAKTPQVLLYINPGLLFQENLINFALCNPKNPPKCGQIQTIRNLGGDDLQLS